MATPVATRGATYAEIPLFATADAKGTNNPTRAQRDSNGEPVGNPTRDLWATETALSTALTMSYMAEQISLFGIAVGSALLLIGLAGGVVVKSTTGDD